MTRSPVACIVVVIYTRPLPCISMILFTATSVLKPWLYLHRRFLPATQVSTLNLLYRAIWRPTMQDGHLDLVLDGCQHIQLLELLYVSTDPVLCWGLESSLSATSAGKMTEFCFCTELQCLSGIKTPFSEIPVVVASSSSTWHQCWSIPKCSSSSTILDLYALNRLTAHLTWT